jgi:dTDP-4-dehydrorhamnose reductase
MLGRDLAALMRSHGDAPITCTRSDLDVTREAAVHTVIRRCRPDVVVNCAAWTAVDAAEQDEPAALAVNGHGATHVAAACAVTGARLIHVSTDYVFGGGAGRPHAEHDPPAPGTAYGRTKLAGERAVLRLLPRAGYVVRTAWLYGRHGSSFVGAMIARAAGDGPVDVVDDQWGQPTWTVDLAGQIAALAAAAAPAGVYHATSSGQTTWFGLAKEVFRLLGADTGRVRPVTSEACPRPARRPAYSVLGHGGWNGTGVAPIRHWRQALAEALPQLTAAPPARSEPARA